MDEWSVAASKLAVDLKKREIDLVIDQGNRWDALQAEKQAEIIKYGLASNYEEKEKKLLADFKNEEKEFKANELAEFDKLVETVYGTKQQEAEKPTQPVESQSYRDKVLQFKDEREKFMREHFEEMASIARDPSISEEEIKYFIDRDNNSIMIMAHSHYKQLMDHPENPYFKQQMETLKREDEIQKQAELKRQQEQKAQQQKQRLERMKLFYEEKDTQTQKQKV